MVTAEKSGGGKGRLTGKRERRSSLRHSGLESNYENAELAGGVVKGSGSKGGLMAHERSS